VSAKNCSAHRGTFYASRHDDVAAKTFDRPRIEKPVTRRAIESDLYELNLWVYVFADQRWQLLPKAVEPLNPAFRLPQLDVVTIDKMLGSLDGLVFILAKQIDRILHPAIGP
jgi:hypothetical protein